MQTSPESIFTKNRMCTLARESGRATLMNGVLTLADERGSKETEIPPDALPECLRTQFGITLP
jgi:arylamine N-acetyltransferase